jgi:hypothetical protein
MADILAALAGKHAEVAERKYVCSNALLLQCFKYGRYQRSCIPLHAFRTSDNCYHFHGFSLPEKS